MRRPARTVGLVLAAAALAVPVLAQTVVVVAARGGNLREKPDRAAAVVGRVESGTELEIVDRSGEWYEIVVPANGETAWVHQSVVRLLGDAAPEMTPGGARAAPGGARADEPGTDDPIGPAVEGADADDDPPRAARRGLAARLTAFAGGALVTAGSGFAGQRRFTEFAEEGRIDADYARGTGPAFELGLEYALGGRFGVAASFNLVGGGTSTTYEASLPHPLYLDRPRRATGDLDGLSYGERTLHLALTYRRGRGRIRYGAFAGPSYGSVRVELVDRVQYQQSFPFDEVQVTGVPPVSHRGAGFGYNVGAELDYRWRSRLGAVLRLRYHRLGPELPETAGTVDIDAGGLQVGAGLRLSFR
jgi:hypothetical protein